MRIFNLIRTMAIMENIRMSEKEGYAVNILFEGNDLPFHAFPRTNEMKLNGRKSPERYEEPTAEEVEKWQIKKEQ